MLVLFRTCNPCRTGSTTLLCTRALNGPKGLQRVDRDRARDTGQTDDGTRVQNHIPSRSVGALVCDRDIARPIAGYFEDKTVLRGIEIGDVQDFAIGQRQD